MAPFADTMKRSMTARRKDGRRPDKDGLRLTQQRPRLRALLGTRLRTFCSTPGKVPICEAPGDTRGMPGFAQNAADLARAVP